MVKFWPQSIAASLKKWRIKMTEEQKIIEEKADALARNLGCYSGCQFHHSNDELARIHFYDAYDGYAIYEDYEVEWDENGVMIKSGFLGIDGMIGGDVSCKESVLKMTEPKPTLADELKKLAELKKAYESLNYELSERYYEPSNPLANLREYAMQAIDKRQSCFYVIDWRSEYYPGDLTSYVWFDALSYYIDNIKTEAESHGFKAEYVDLEHIYEPEEGEEAHTVKALKITWGE
jgi:hypothetical protein